MAVQKKSFLTSLSGTKKAVAAKKVAPATADTAIISPTASKHKESSKVTKTASVKNMARAM